MNKQYLIEKIVPNRTIGIDDFSKGWEACRAVVLKNISSLDLNGWVRVEDVVKAINKTSIDNEDEQRSYSEVLNRVFQDLGVEIGGKSTEVIEMLVSGLGEYAIRLAGKIEKSILSTLAPQEENKN